MKDPNFKTPKEEWWVVVFIIAALCIPLYVTLLSVHGERPRVEVDVKQELFPSMHRPDADFSTHRNPSPLGYTASLTIWLFPVLLILCHLFRFLKPRRKRLIFRSVLLTTGILGGLGLLLDILFGMLFFTFPNRDAVIGICLPAVTWHHTDEFMRWDLIPIEEFGFYFFGSLSIILMYVWCNEYWLSEYKIKDDDVRRRELVKRFRWSILHWRSLRIGVIILVMGWIYRNYISDVGPGFPGYLAFLTAIGILPSLIMYRYVKKLINFRALSCTLLMTLLISTSYEVILGVPYQWWGFRPEQMMGFSIAGFSGVPVEEPILWVAIVWASVIFFEMAHTFLHHGVKESLQMVKETLKKPERKKS